jgi:integrase
VPTIQKRRNRNGSASYVAWVRVRPFKSISKAFAKRSEAKSWADSLSRELHTQRDRGGLRRDVTKMTVAQLAREFLEDPETAGLRYYGSLALLLAWWTNHYGAERVLAFNVLRLREARDKLRTGRAPGTVNRYLSAMRSAWNWGRASGLVPQDLLWPSRLMLTEPKGRTRYLTDEELAALLKAAATHSPTMNAAVLVSLGCGVRQSELLRLKWADVDFDKQRLRVLLSKNNESRVVYLPQAAVATLRELKRAKVVGQLVFTDEAGQQPNKFWLEYRWRCIRDEVGLRDFRWHDLRHSCASFLAQEGANLLEIGSVLGHKSPTVTRRYSHLVEGAPVTGHTKLDEKLRQGGKVLP